MRAEKPEVELHVVRGANMAESPRTRVLGRWRRDRLETLYVLVDPLGDASDAICGTVLRAVDQEFRVDGISLTSTLLRSMKAVQRVLRDENRRSLLEHQVRVGLTCALRRGDEVYLAQAGPDTVFPLRGRQIATPEDGAGDADGQPLGLEEEPQPQLHHFFLEPDTGILLISSTVGRQLAGSGSAILPGDGSSVSDHLRRLAGPNSTFSALIIAPGRLASPDGHDCRSGDAEDTTAKAATGRPTPSPVTVGRGPRLAQVQPATRSGSTAEPTEGRHPDWRIRPTQGLPRFGRGTTPAANRRRTRTGMSGAVSAIASRLAGLSERRLPRPNVGALYQAARTFLPQDPPPPSRSVGGSSTLAMPSSWQSSPWPDPSMVAQFVRPHLLSVAAFLAAAALLVAAWYLPGLLARPGGPDGVANPVEAAEATRLKALASGDRTAMRRDLQEAERILVAALSRGSSDPAVLSLRATIQADLARLDAIYKLTDLRPLVPGSAIRGGAQRLGQLLVSDSQLYTLDRGNGTAYRFVLASGRDRLADRGSAIVAGAGAGPAQVAEMVHMPAGGVRAESGVLIIGADRSLWEYRPTEGLKPIQIRGARDWGNLTSALGYDGNLYVLDSQSSQVWRYLPTHDGYNSEMGSTLGRVTLGSPAVDMAIDGSIYLLTSGGKLWKFAGGQSQALSLTGLDRELLQPSALYTNRDSRFLYVADAGNKRVVVLDKDGRYVRQLLPADDIVPQDLYADEASGLIYLAGEKGVYVATLP